LLAGLEGFFAFTALLLLLIPLGALGWEVGFSQFGDFFVGNVFVFMGSFGIIGCDMVYTLLCLVLTNRTSALVRSGVFQLRCVTIWMFALLFGWETFSYL
jgi:hypothetical protein